VVSRELASGALVKAHALSLPGYGFYLVSVPTNPQQPNIEAFSAWMRSVV
jgi:LysR family glycine cleavage system transcriptional activator